jgi:hypothetical protein
MLVLLTVMMVIYHVGYIIYLVLGEEPLPTFEFLYKYGFLCGVIWFIKGDAKGSEVAQAYCPGVTIGSVWVFLLPYHLIKSRGTRGLIPLFAFIGLWLAFQVLTQIVNMMYTGAFR